MIDMIPYWFDRRDDGIDLVLALSDHSLRMLFHYSKSFMFLF